MSRPEAAVEGREHGACRSPTGAPGLGEPGKPVRSVDDLDRTIQQITATLSRDFSDDLACDPIGFCRRVVGLGQGGPSDAGAGPPGIPEVTAGAAMREQGKPWSEIYPSCIPDYAALDPTIRRWRQRELRDRVRSRRYQQRKHRKLLGQAPSSALCAINRQPVIRL